MRCKVIANFNKVVQKVPKKNTQQYGKNNSGQKKARFLVILRVKKFSEGDGMMGEWRMGG